MATQDQVQRAVDLVQEYVDYAGSGAQIVGGDVRGDYISLDFNAPHGIDLGHVSDQVGAPITESAGGQTITIYSPK